MPVTAWIAVWGRRGSHQFIIIAMRLRVKVVTSSVTMASAECLIVNRAWNGSSSWLVSHRATVVPLLSTHWRHADSIATKAPELMQ